MIVSWLVYCVVVAGLLGIAAVAAESALRALGRPVRWAWTGALAGSVLVPLAAWLRPAASVSALDAPGPVGVLEVLPALEFATPAASPGLARVLALAWLLLSASLLVLIARTHLRLRAERRRWEAREIGGVPVYLSRDIGPAALGFFRGVIVVPEWTLGLETHLLELMVLHEREHLRAGDPRLLWLGLAAAVAQPWNPVVWWQLRRLRLAIEFDCDARVLRREPDAREYGALLLEVGRRHLGIGVAAAALSEPQSFLERRIRMMLRPKGQGGALRASVLGLATLALVALACEAPEPTGELMVTPAAVVAPSDGYVPFTPGMMQPTLTNVSGIVQALEANYPPLLREAGIGGTVLVSLWIDDSGVVMRQEMTQSSGYPALDQAAVKVAGMMEFSPARNDGKPVPVMVQIPISFRTAVD